MKRPAELLQICHLQKKYINLLGIAHSMKYLHKDGIIHRNFKTENVLLDENFYPKLNDFRLNDFRSRKFSQSLENSNFFTMLTGIGAPFTWPQN